MSVLSIKVQQGTPTRGFSSQFTSTILLEGVRYAFSFYTNKLRPAWYFDIQDPTTGDVIVGSLGLTTGLDLLYPYKYNPLVPPGTLYVSDLAKTRADPVVESFAQNEAILYYLTTDDPAFQRPA